MWGFRFSFRPLDSLEVSFSRTAQWCGDGRPCDLSTFWKLFIGDDNRNVNVDEEDEPGNQLGGIDLRWSLPNRIPAAIYAQWIGEDGRAEEGPVLVGSFSRQLGLETWGRIGGLSHRTHIEVSEISCRKGEFGSSERNSNCAYEHGIYRTGYRYKGRPIGHGTDGDGRSYSLGSTLVQSAGHTWSATIRFMEINFEGQPNPRHTLSPTPQDRADIQISHERMTRFGRWYFAAGYQYLDDKATGSSTSDITGFIRWSSH